MIDADMETLGAENLTIRGKLSYWREWLELLCMVVWLYYTYHVRERGREKQKEKEKVPREVGMMLVSSPHFYELSRNYGC